MKNEITKWSKKELKIYILLVCAKADNIEAVEEIKFIKTKVSEKKFNKIYKEFEKDNEDESLEKIQDSISNHQYSNLELCQMKNEIQEVFAADRKIAMSESNLGRILDNIIY